VADASLSVDTHLSAGGQELQPSDVYSSITGVMVAPLATEHWFDCAKALVAQHIRAKAAMDWGAENLEQRHMDGMKHLF